MDLISEDLPTPATVILVKQFQHLDIRRTFAACNKDLETPELLSSRSERATTGHFDARHDEFRLTILYHGWQLFILLLAGGYGLTSSLIVSQLVV